MAQQEYPIGLQDCLAELMKIELILGSPLARDVSIVAMAEPLVAAPKSM